MNEDNLITLTTGKLVIKTDNLGWIDDSSFEVIDFYSHKKYIFKGVDRMKMLAAYSKSNQEQNPEGIGCKHVHFEC